MAENEEFTLELADQSVENSKYIFSQPARAEQLKTVLWRTVKPLTGRDKEVHCVLVDEALLALRAALKGLEDDRKNEFDESQQSSFVMKVYSLRGSLLKVFDQPNDNWQDKVATYLHSRTDLMFTSFATARACVDRFWERHQGRARARQAVKRHRSESTAMTEPALPCESCKLLKADIEKAEREVEKSAAHLETARAAHDVTWCMGEEKTKQLQEQLEACRALIKKTKEARDEWKHKYGIAEVRIGFMEERFASLKESLQHHPLEAHMNAVASRPR